MVERKRSRERNTTTTLSVRFRRTTAAPSTNLYTIFLLLSRGFHRWCLFRHPTPTTLARFRSSSPAIHFRSSSPANEKYLQHGWCSGVPAGSRWPRRPRGFRSSPTVDSLTRFDPGVKRADKALVVLVPHFTAGRDLVMAKL
ncbi:hypothetical protein E3N88_40987 [Mikania micrantha]|uniref:Uncharacterized protein n=1 Tax=Mikania micrantha TaxID=192012 RepID=A0A5N6LP44_9ASTR|nr:hypothetical protein E3N88_40987 [Mikania micrantha]